MGLHIRNVASWIPNTTDVGGKDESSHPATKLIACNRHNRAPRKAKRSTFLESTHIMSNNKLQYCPKYEPHYLNQRGSFLENTKSGTGIDWRGVPIPEQIKDRWANHAVKRKTTLPESSVT
jgi:hypothetical protein